MLRQSGLVRFAFLLLHVSFQVHAATIGASSSSSRNKDQPILLVVSYDSFNKRYLDSGASPNLKQVQEAGSSVSHLRNVFPTKTFPNHFSIATGLYPDKHGVLNNVVFDKKLGMTKYGHEYFHMDEDVTPIWTLNELSGGHSACIMYPGSNFKYQNRSCTFTEVYKPKYDFEKRVDVAFLYMQHPKTPANLVMLYFEQPDDAGHKHGPESKQVADEIKHVDEITKLILESAKKYKLEKRLNVIFMSDHGMTTVHLKDMIDLTKYTDSKAYKMYGSSPVVQIVPEDGQFDAVLKSLRDAATSVGHFQVYTNQELPDRWHYRNDRRAGPITIVADLGFVFNDFHDHVAWFKDHNVTKTNEEYGLHGYDNALEVMQAIFMARGPAFKTKFQGKPIDNVDLYYLFCKLLHLRAPTWLDGNETNIEQFLVGSDKGLPNANQIRSGKTLMLGIACAIIAISIIVVAIVIWTWRRCHGQARHQWRKLELDAAFSSNSEATHLIDSDSESETLYS